MKTILKFVLCISAACILAACQKGLTPNSTDGKSLQDGITISLLFPEMPSVETRSIGAAAPALTNLDIFLFVFDGTNLLQTIRIDRTATTAQAGGSVKFKAWLPQTDDNAAIHIIAIDDGADAAGVRRFSAQVDAASYGIEDTVMPSFFVGNQQDAYWARIDLGCPIRSSVINDDNPLENVTGTEDRVNAAFAHPVPLIRNFAKIKVTEDAGNFDILGWCIVNALDAGSVVPWFSLSGSPDIIYPEYADWSDGSGKNEPKTYAQLSAQGYRGVSQNGASRLSCTDAGSNAPNGFYRTADIEGMTGTAGNYGLSWGTGEKYLYERHTVSVNPLYLLVYGKVEGSTGLAAGNYYYKIALGHTDTATGLFTEYNVLRNIEYTVNITSVSGVGYDTPAGAAEAPAFNNISGDVTTRNLFSISDGVDMLTVNNITYVITTDEQADEGFDFRYRYIAGITGAKRERNDLVVWNNPDVGLKSGSVIKTFSNPPSDYTDPRNGTGWKNFRITTEHPTDELKQQTFTVYSCPGGDISDPNVTMGLSRTMTVILRNPWDFVKVQTYPGLWEDDSKYPDFTQSNTPEEEDVNFFIGPQKGAELTIFFELPAGLPESIFPLYFTIESDRQNIENAGVGSAVVETGPSLFEGVTDNRIKYIYTVNWDKYAPDGENSTAQSRIFRARFVTTTAITSLADKAIITTVVVHNPYFNDATDKFKRDQDRTNINS